MKITHLIDSIDPSHGGPTAVVLQLAAAQARLGYDIRILTRPYTEQVEAVEQACDSLGLDPQDNIATYDSLSQRPIQDADVLHLHGVWDKILIQGASAARKQSTPYVVTPHGMLDPWCLTQKPLKKKLALALFVKRMLNHAAFIHVLNKDEGELIKPLGLTAPSITIPNGVSLEQIDPLPDKGLFRKAYPELGDAPYVLFLSRLHYKKGLDILADAFMHVHQAVPEARLVVVGPDDGEEQAFREIVQSKGLADRVLITGPLYGEIKYQAMVDACCFCLPSRQEGFSIAITEALACGLPVVISSDSHFPEVEAAGAGRVCELSGEIVGEALTDVLNDPGRAKSMSQAGRALVESRYTWPKIAERCVIAYQGG